MKKILIIQTAFIGDVILATSLVETISKMRGEEWQIDLLVRKGNESLLVDHPFIKKVIIWDKKSKKYKNLLAVSKQVRGEKYAIVYNLQRFASTGFLTWRSKAKLTIGFKNNPLSFLFGIKVSHDMTGGEHEIERNVKLLQADSEGENIKAELPKLYPSEANKLRVQSIIEDTPAFVVMAPASVWFTKQLPKSKWIELIQVKSKKTTVYLIGGPSDFDFIQELIDQSGVKDCINMAGKLNLLESAALIGKASRSYVNDSAPLHLASAMNAPVTAFFCSTVPRFGFGPLSEDTIIKEIERELECRPCGLHGLKACPKGHFNCGNEINIEST